ncbi:glycosyltransferase [Echinicola rosea]|uniref:Glycoside hydrolase n=1 Tax=Echinicola rosea TaxID=1807691 RepID=A0ABQ1V507_9BACT|nr:glycosyltransferase [Echinicola rosea]GGF38041.1 glycoside hydrolase [Echinicola rosea]
MKIVVIAGLKPSQVIYKLKPLAKVDMVDEIFLIRKENGPQFDKLKYIILPKLLRIRPFYLMLSPFFMFSKIRKIKPDLILSYNFKPHGFFAYILSKVTSTPFIFSEIDNLTQDYMKIWPVGNVISNAMHEAKHLNVPGNNTKNYWLDQGIPAEKISILHSTINTKEDFLPSPRTPKEFDFIYIGVLEERKNVNLIIEALGMLKQKGLKPRFLVVGKGPMMEPLQAQVKQLELEDQVHFAGHSPHVVKFIHQSRFFILTSKVEGIPCAMMESMACGLPALGTDVADIADIVNHETGFLIDKPDSTLISEAIEKAMTLTDEEYHKLSQSARDLIVNYHSHEYATLSWNNLLKTSIKEPIYEKV